MTKYTFALLMTACVTTAALAQAPVASVGVVESAEGLVTVSQENTLGNLVKDAKISNGARVMTTSTGSATLKLASGCVIALAPNQVVTIDSRLDCKTLVSNISSTGTLEASAGATSTAAFIPAIAGGALAVGIVANENKDKKPKPNSSGS